jgi:hypothetical protein
VNAVVITPAVKKAGTALTVQQRAERALKVTEKREQELRALAASSKDIVVITNADGREQVHAMCMVLRNTRLDIGSDADSVREDAKQFNKSVLALEKKLIGITQPEEDRLRKLRDDWDAARQREKEAEIAAEQARVAAIQARIEEMRCAIVGPAVWSSAEITKRIDRIESVVVDETFEELQQAAIDARDAALGRLRQMHDAAVAHEAEQAKIKADREELERLREAEKVRQAAERKRLADEAHARKVAQDAENARQEAARKAQLEEDKRQAAARQKVLDEQAAALAAERAEIDRQREELLKAQAPFVSFTSQHVGSFITPDPVTVTLSDGTEPGTKKLVVDCPGLETEVFDNIGAGPAEIANAVNSGSRLVHVEPGAILTRREIKAPTATEIVVALHKEWPAHPSVILGWLQSIDWHMQAFTEVV